MHWAPRSLEQTLRKMEQPSRASEDDMLIGWFHHYIFFYSMSLMYLCTYSTSNIEMCNTFRRSIAYFNGPHPVEERVEQ